MRVRPHKSARGKEEQQVARTFFSGKKGFRNTRRTIAARTRKEERKEERKDRNVRCSENMRSQHGGFCAKMRLWPVFALNAPFATFWPVTSAIILDSKKVDMREFCNGKKSPNLSEFFALFSFARRFRSSNAQYAGVMSEHVVKAPQ